MIVLDSATDAAWLTGWATLAAAIATWLAMAGAWWAVAISLKTSRLAEADRALVLLDRANRRRDEREAQARSIRMGTINTPGGHGTRGDSYYFQATLEVTNDSDDPIRAVELAIEVDPESALHPDARDVKTRKILEPVLAPGARLMLSAPIRMTWPAEQQETPQVRLLPWFRFTDFNSVRWVRGPDYVNREVLEDSAKAEDDITVIQRIGN